MTDRVDLGARLGRSTRRLIDLERPVLEAHGLSMWEYVVLTRLRDGDAPTQLALARDVRHDKTRLIAILDRLADEELIRREPAPEDRRARVVSLTPRGRERVDAVRGAIHTLEDELLAGVDAGERAAFERVLGGLAG